VPAAETVLAADIGGTKTSVALVRNGQVLQSLSAPTPAGEGPESVVLALGELAERLLGQPAAGQAPRRLGVACAGLVRSGRVTAVSRDLLPGWDDFPLDERLAASLGLEVKSLNDAQAAALGEHVAGAGQGRASLLFMTVSTGVGGGLVLGGRLWRGADGLAGHIGHLRDGEPERLASGTALARRAREAGRPGLDAAAVLAAAARNEDWAARLLREAVAALAAVIGDARMLVDPGALVIGGSVGLNPVFREALERQLTAAAGTRELPVFPARLGAAAGLVGAAAWVLGQGQ